MVIIGCDFHPSGQQVLAIEDRSGEVVSERWLNHAGEEAEQFYASLPAGAVVGVESRKWFVCRAARVIPWSTTPTVCVSALPPSSPEPFSQDGEAGSLHEESWCCHRPNRWLVEPVQAGPTT